jgi:hypothetical protein
MNLNQWAIKWGVPFEAVEDLRRQFGAIPETYPEHIEGESEAAVQTRIRLEASKKGLRLWRNNVGAAQTDNGFLRYGLANESKQMNNMIKSSDLIGIRPIRIEPHHVGSIIGQFVAREVKAADWIYTNSKREQAQLAFLELVAGMGGDAAFAISEGTL